MRSMSLPRTPIRKRLPFLFLGMILMNSYNSTVQIFAIFGIMALVYFVVCFTLSQIVRAYQRKIKQARTA